MQSVFRVNNEHLLCYLKNLLIRKSNMTVAKHESAYRAATYDISFLSARV